MTKINYNVAGNLLIKTSVAIGLNNILYKVQEHSSLRIGLGICASMNFGSWLLIDLQLTNLITVFVVLYTMIFFRTTVFLYSPCPNLEGTNDALCYKFRRLMIGQNCSAVCTNEGGHRDAFLTE